MKRKDADRVTFDIKPSQTKDASVFEVIGVGKRAYLWVGKGTSCITFLTGQNTLRKLAYAILRQTDDRKGGRP